MKQGGDVCIDTMDKKLEDIYLNASEYQDMLDSFDYMLQKCHYQDIPTNKNGLNVKSKIYNHTKSAHLQFLYNTNTIAVHLEGSCFPEYFETDVSGFGQFLYHQYFYEHWIRDTFNKYNTATNSNSDFTTINCSSTAISCSSDIAISDNDYNTITTINNDIRTLNINDLDYLKNVEQAEKEEAVEKKENKEMKGINFDFGPCNGNVVRMSMYGMAVKNFNDTFVAYDPKTDSIMDVDIFNFDGSKFFYKIPVPIKNVKKGDVVVHNRRPCFVLDYGPNSKSLIVVDPIDGEKKEIMLTRSPFGFDFATKVVGLMDMCGQGMTATEDNPFGNMWMFAMMDGNMNDMLPFMMMANNGGNMNPMMMYFMMNNENKDNLLPLMFMMNNN